MTFSFGEYLFTIVKNILLDSNSKVETRKPYMIVCLLCMVDIEKRYYGYTYKQWFKIVVCYVVFLFFGGIEASVSIYYSLMKTELEIPYKVQGWLVSMGSYSFIIGSPIIGYIMTKTDVKPILVISFVCYFVGYMILYQFRTIWVVFSALFIEGLGGVMLDVGMNTLSTVIFGAHRGVMMNSLHFFYGLGSAIGPTYSGFIYTFLKQGYKGIFVGLSIPIVLGFVFTIITHLSLNHDEYVEEKIEGYKTSPSDIKEAICFVTCDTVTMDPTVVIAESNMTTVVDHVVKSSSVCIPSVINKVETTPTAHLTILSAFITPMVWLLGINMGAVYAIESITINWAPLYLQERFNMSPEVEGSQFISLFYIYYTLARLVIGFIIDWIGDTLSVILFNCLLILLYVVGFLMDKSGVWILAFSGFLISPFYPTSITIPMEVFGKEAKTMISVELCIALIVNAVIQVLIGYMNEFVGPQWGYPIMSFAMCLLMMCCMVIIYMVIKKKK